MPLSQCKRVVKRSFWAREVMSQFGHCVKLAPRPGAPPGGLLHTHRKFTFLSRRGGEREMMAVLLDAAGGENKYNNLKQHGMMIINIIINYKHK